MSIVGDELRSKLQTYLATHWQQPVTVTDVRQIPGGASRETFRFRAARGDTSDGFVLRRDPPSSLIDTERRHEYLTYAAMVATAIPVPEPILLEEDATLLGGAFSIMREVPGCEASPALLAGPPYAAVKEQLGQRAWSLLGQLARTSVTELGVVEFMEVPEHPALRELDYWAEVIRADQLHPEPVAEAAIRWLYRHLPEPSSERVLVHGDYRSGNFLYNAEGEIKAILDWEMAHIGDPLEDLAWSLDPLWSLDPHLAGNLLSREAALGVWEQASGISVDRSAFRWWQVFASLKGLAIWISSTEDFHRGSTKEPILAMAGWVMTDRQNRILIDRLRPDGQQRWAEPLI
ncbi:MAG: phosphotransferase family protein [Pseudomonadales bacterium]